MGQNNCTQKIETNFELVNFTIIIYFLNTNFDIYIKANKQKLLQIFIYNLLRSTIMKLYSWQAN